MERYKFKKHKYVYDQKAFPELSRKWFCITDELLDVVALDPRINDDTISYLLSCSYAGQNFTYITGAGTLSHFLHRCYLHGKTDLVDRVLSAFEKNNAYAYENIHVDQPQRTVGPKWEMRIYISQFSYNGLSVKNRNVEHYICTVLRKTIDLAISKGDAYYIKKFNQINQDIRNHYERFYLYLEEIELV